MVRRGAVLFDQLIVGVLDNPRKSPLFTIAERVALIEAEVEDLGPSVSVEAFTGLTVEFAARHEAGFVIRGLRAIMTSRPKSRWHTPTAGWPPGSTPCSS